MEWHPLPSTQRLPVKDAAQVLWVLGYGVLLLSQVDINGCLEKGAGEAALDGAG